MAKNGKYEGWHLELVPNNGNVPTFRASYNHRDIRGKVTTYFWEAPDTHTAINAVTKFLIEKGIKFTEV